MRFKSKKLYFCATVAALNDDKVIRFIEYKIQDLRGEDSEHEIWWEMTERYHDQLTIASEKLAWFLVPKFLNHTSLGRVVI